jgi:hypothetical protein
LFFKGEKIVVVLILCGSLCVRNKRERKEREREEKEIYKFFRTRVRLCVCLREKTARRQETGKAETLCEDTSERGKKERKN